MVDPLETYFKLCVEAVQECGPGADIAAIDKALRRRVAALPRDQQDAINEKVGLLTSFTGPGFHEQGPH